jgi:STE24 endopeptidase
VALLSHTGIELWLNLRQQRHILAHRGQVPDDFSSVVSLADHQKAADYSIAKLSLGRVQLVIDAILLVIMVMAGGFQVIYDWVTTQVALAEVWQQVVFLLLVFWLMSLAHLPLSWYATFRIEEQFGFNKMTLCSCPKIRFPIILANAFFVFLTDQP